jgi:MerR family transcriptional regulator, copper efflux regulator
MQLLTIGQVARQAEIGVETVRFYEREGLLEPPQRRQSGYRQFEPNVIDRIRFIKRAQQLGFTLREVKELLGLRFDPLATRGEVREAAIAKLADIDQKIADLNRMKRALQPLVDSCDGQGTVDGCPILAALERPTVSMACKKHTSSKPSQNV